MNEIVRLVKILVCAAVTAASVQFVSAEDWPVYMKDGFRSGVSADAIPSGSRQIWMFDPGAAPGPGFYPQAAERNIGQQGLIVQTMTFDYAYAPVLAGGRLYFGSSTDQAVHCLDMRTGVKQWSFFAEGAVRFAPAVEKGRVYFGSDDGFVYCLDAVTGALIWKYNAAPEDRRIIANGRVASQWPVRTSVIVHNGTVYFSAGLFPASGGVYLFALKADSGEVVWRRGSLSPSQGYILAAEDLLFVPNGRASPTEFRQADGTTLTDKFDLRRSGGSAFTAMMDDMVIYGPTEFGIVHFRAVNDGQEMKGLIMGRDRIIRGKITGLDGWRALKNVDSACFLSGNELVAMPFDLFKKSLIASAENFLQRTKDKSIVTKSGVQMSGDKTAAKEMDGYARWKAPVKGGRSLIAAGQTVFAGGDGEIKGFDLESGDEQFSFPVDGTAWELAASDGLLFAATDSGRIYCFGATSKAGGEIRAAAGSVFNDAKQESFKALAKLAIEKAGRDRGFCLIAGAGEGRLAYEMTKASSMQVVCVEKDPATAAKARENLVKAGVYGTQAVVHVREDGKLPYAGYFANLILSESLASGGSLDFSAEELYGLLQPFGGALVLATPDDLGAEKAKFKSVQEWSSGTAGGFSVAVHKRGILLGAGEWSHMFANPQNTASSGDQLVRGSDYLLQWFGDPSPIEPVGWHYNGMGPLAMNGKIVNIRAYSVECVDAYNGTLLWHNAIPEVTRLNVAREGGSGCLDESRLYLAVKNDCRVLDILSGKVVSTWLGPDEQNDWGFIAVDGSRLFGTKQNPLATTTEGNWSRDPAVVFRQLWNASEPDMAVSSSFFSLDKKTGDTLWNYAKSGRVLLNSSITIGDQAVYWVESRNPQIAADPDGSVGLADFFAQNSFLVAADIRSGDVLWEIPFQSKAQGIFYLSLYNGLLVETASYHVGPLAGKRHIAAGSSKEQETPIHYFYRALDAGTGEIKWESDYASSGMAGHQHNYNISHPVFAGGYLYNSPAEQYFVKVNLETGALTENKAMKRSKGCATPTGSEHTIFFRSMGIGGIDLAEEKQFYLSDVNRPSCWMNILPAGGLVLIPEYSFGCMCGFPLQTSVVFAPGKTAQPVEVQRSAR